MTARSGNDRHFWVTNLWPVGAVVAFAGLGFAVDQFWGDPEIEVAIGRLPEYIGNGFSLLVAVACVAIVAVGLPLSVFTALRSAGQAAVSAVRFVRSHSWRYMVAKAAPVAFPTVVVVGFVVATGGPNAIGFWVAAVAGSFMALAMVAYVAQFFAGVLESVGEGLGSLTRRLLRSADSRTANRAAAAVEYVAMVGPLFAAFSGIFIHVAQNVADRAPLYLPLRSGWGIYSALMVGSAAVVGSAKLGLAVRDRLLPPVADADVDRPGEYWTHDSIIGWRAWVWTGTELHGYRQPWTSAEFAARCDTCPEIPGEDHGCGVYAVIERRHLSAFSLMSRSEVVVGRVELTGLVIEHERGYRAERARIAELFAPPGIVADVSARYPDTLVTEQPVVTLE